MKSPATDFLSPVALDALRQLGQNITEARRRRSKRQADVATQAMLSLSTYRKVEEGDPTVMIGNYVSVLAVLGLLATGIICSSPSMWKMWHRQSWVV